MQKPEHFLQAANKTANGTYGQHSLSLSIRLRPVFRGILQGADVTYAILGADFLRNFNLLVAMQGRILIDATTGVTVEGIMSKSSPSRANIIKISKSKVELMVVEYPSLTSLNNCHGLVQRDVRHRIFATGPCSCAPTLRLHPEKLKIVTAELNEILKLGIIQPSASSWAHGAQQCNSSRPIPFTWSSWGHRVWTKSKRFFKDRFYNHQIPVALEDFPKQLFLLRLCSTSTCVCRLICEMKRKCFSVSSTTRLEGYHSFIHMSMIFLYTATRQLSTKLTFDFYLSVLLRTEFISTNLNVSSECQNWNSWVIVLTRMAFDIFQKTFNI